MTNNILITRPNHELIVSYLCFWGKELIQLAEAKGFRVSDFKGQKANRKNFDKYLKKQNPILILLNGHGSNKMVMGFNNEPLLILNQNDDLVKGSIIHALSCNSSSRLGKTAVEKGAKAYLGYKFPFTILTDKNNESRPMKDKLASVFKDPAIEIPKQLINNKTVKFAYEKAKAKYKEQILFYSASDSPEEAEYIRFALFSNMIALDLQCEDENAKIKM